MIEKLELFSQIAHLRCEIEQLGTKTNAVSQAVAQRNSKPRIKQKQKSIANKKEVVSRIQEKEKTYEQNKESVRTLHTNLQALADKTRTTAKLASQQDGGQKITEQRKQELDGQLRELMKRIREE